LEYLINYDYLERKEMHLPSLKYPILSKMKDIKLLKILDDAGGLYFTGYIYNSENAVESDFDEILEFMESVGATILMINGEVVLG